MGNTEPSVGLVRLAGFSAEEGVGGKLGGIVWEVPGPWGELSHRSVLLASSSV